VQCWRESIAAKSGHDARVNRRVCRDGLPKITAGRELFEKARDRWRPEPVDRLDVAPKSRAISGRLKSAAIWNISGAVSPNA
jgi:hypothetical protein